MEPRANLPNAPTWLLHTTNRATHSVNEVMTAILCNRLSFQFLSVELLNFCHNKTAVARSVQWKQIFRVWKCIERVICAHPAASPYRTRYHVAFTCAGVNSIGKQNSENSEIENASRRERKKKCRRARRVVEKTSRIVFVMVGRWDVLCRA